MRSIHMAGLAGIALCTSAAAVAGEVPLYQPAPAWVVPAQLPAKLDQAPAIVLLDLQNRIEDGRLWAYLDTATRIDSAEVLAQFSALTLPWMPDKGDLIVHELSILRGGQRIDLLAQGQKFVPLRREETLEQRELTGILTATLAVEGLQVGDVLRLRVSHTEKDPALSGRAQAAGQLIPAPMQLGFGRLLFSWPSAAAPKWKILADGVAAAPVTEHGYSTISIALPTAKQPEMPSDAPVRFRHPPLIEFSTFAGWEDVSKVMAPLYRTDGLIAPGSPLAAEVDAIVKAEATPILRAERALELVQDKIRYLAVGMNGGNYVPQAPARTWELRYGDCKAKTLLLLSMLHAMGIEAEPVLASVDMGDFVSGRLPTAAAFNHVFVRATIGGEALWLDGTASGSRMADIHDTPAFGSVLPVRAAGAGLVRIEPRPAARPAIDLAIDADESSSSDLPSAFDAKAVVRGQMASLLTVRAAQLAGKEKRELLGGFMQSVMGEAQFSDIAMTSDAAQGAVVVNAKGVSQTPWYTDLRKRKRTVVRAFESSEFAPDRARPAWKTIPVAANGPSGLRYRLRLRLPDGGRGYTLEGQPDFKGRVAGYQLSRTVRLDGGVLSAEDWFDSTGAEIPAAELPAERDRFATMKANLPRLIAPDGMLRRWEVPAGRMTGTQLKAVEAVLAAAIALNPESVEALTSRASFLSGMGDSAGARADLGRAIALQPSVDLYLQRGQLAADLGDFAAAAADGQAARDLDPTATGAVTLLARAKAESGSLAQAVSLLDERIALGGELRSGYRLAKASLIGEYGDPAEAVAIYDSLIEEKPGSPTLLNGRCWVKGTRSLMLDSALKDCTESIELSSESSQMLDSRAMVYFRLGRDTEALRDLDAVLARSPGLAASRFLRSLVLAKLGRRDEAVRDLAVARRIAPGVDREYAHFGLKADFAPAAASAARSAR